MYNKNIDENDKNIYNLFIIKFLQKHNLVKKDVFLQTRKQELVKIRYAIFTVLREIGLSYSEISKVCLIGIDDSSLKNYHHTTVRHGCIKMQDLKDLYKNDIGFLYESAKETLVQTLIESKSNNNNIYCYDDTMIETYTKDEQTAKIITELH